MAQKVPPPPQLTDPQWQIVNRWLLEVTAILNNSGDIDPNSVAGLPEVILESAANAAAIAILETEVGGQGGDITSLQTQVTSNTNSIATINGQITTLAARAQVLNGTGAPGAGLGNVNDWYADTTNLHIYVKTAVGTWTFIT